MIHRASALLLCLSAVSAWAADAGVELAPLVQRIKEVGRHGEGNVEAAKAWKELVRFGPGALPALLHGMNGADPTAANWLRTAVDAIAERELQANRSLPAVELETYIRNRANSPHGRHLAYEWLCRVDKTAPDRLLPTMLDDPSGGLRREAVAVALREAQAVLDKGDKAAATKAFRRAFDASRDRDQVVELAKQLQALGVQVDLAAHFGFIREWQLLASFDNVKGVGFAAVYPPEQRVDLGAAYRDKEGKDIRWRPARTEDAYGMMNLNKLIGPHKGAVAYAFTVVESPVEQQVEFRAATPNALKMFLNGKQVFGREEYHHGSRMDGHIAVATLRQGRNDLLLKICQNEQTEEWAQSWQFQFRICDDVGGAVAVKVVPLEKPGQGGDKELQKLRQELQKANAELKERQRLLDQEKKENQKLQQTINELRADLAKLKERDSKEDQALKAAIKKLESEAADLRKRLANAEEVSRAPYVHAVLFTLKSDAPVGEADALIKDANDLLGKIPSVKGLWVGKPARQATPDVAVKDYHVGLVIVFDSYKGLKAYLDHPQHKKFVDRHGSYWDKTPVYDFERGRSP